MRQRGAAERHSGEGELVAGAESELEGLDRASAPQGKHRGIIFVPLQIIGELSAVRSPIR